MIQHCKVAFCSVSNWLHEDEDRRMPRLPINDIISIAHAVENLVDEWGRGTEEPVERGRLASEYVRQT